MSQTATDDSADLLVALRAAIQAAGGPEGFQPELARPREPDYGDYSTNAALVLASRIGARPRDLAEGIVAALDTEQAGVAEVTIAGPGFINFRLSDSLLWSGLTETLASDLEFGRSAAVQPERVNVEFVSANPTGPLHVAHGRGAALGDAIASLLEWTGHDVVREFYVNDAGRQIELLGESVEARYQQSQGVTEQVPEGGYHGDYIIHLAAAIAEAEGEERLAAMTREERLTLFTDRAVRSLGDQQRTDLEAFGVRMAAWRSETDLVNEGRIEDLLDRLNAAGLLYSDGGAVWLRTSELGDEKDRVLVKSDGFFTYFTPDIAYHLDKAERGFDRAIDIWGADHHGHEQRMLAALDGLGLPGFLEVVILQLVTILRGGVEARMSKRAGTFVTLRELVDETGADVARYFFLMRRGEVHLNFDLDLALDTSEANPVYKIQYAHARMCSVFRKGEMEPESLEATVSGLDALTTTEERKVVKAVLRLPEVVRHAAEARAPHQVCTYLEDTAGLVNSWYHTGNLDPSRRVLFDGPAREGRLKLARAVQITLRNGLHLLGLSAPEAMTRSDTAQDQTDER
jgi:arginyl-tRNA synthetase